MILTESQLIIAIVVVIIIVIIFHRIVNAHAPDESVIIDDEEFNAERLPHDLLVDRHHVEKIISKDGGLLNESPTNARILLRNDDVITFVSINSVPPGDVGITCYMMSVAPIGGGASTKYIVCTVLNNMPGITLVVYDGNEPTNSLLVLNKSGTIVTEYIDGSVVQIVHLRPIHVVPADSKTPALDTLRREGLQPGLRSY